MSYYAKVLDGKVLQIMVADATYMNSFEDETPGTWIETSKRTEGGVLYDVDGTKASDQSGALRKNYATMGGNYDVWDDAFYNVQPFPSWTLNKTTYLWEPPITDPGGDVYWDEDAYQADNTKGWTAFPR
tara:strand:- start:47 stop:433 length:387 start_codon:yes stop_codon:yes gene_type:complete